MISGKLRNLAPGDRAVKSTMSKWMVSKSLITIIVFVLIISTAAADFADSTELKSASRSGEPSGVYSSGNYNSSCNNSSIKFEGQNKIAQAPATISVGRGYYSSHPISYSSEIGSRTLIEDERSATSMQGDINYAHGINGEMDVGATEGSYSMDGLKSGGLAITHMKIDENVTDGRVHVGVLQGNDDSGMNTETGGGGTINDGADPSMDAWKKPAMEIDEDYIGTYHIYKNMTINTRYDQYNRCNSWLDGCSEERFDTNWPGPFSISADRIFNCKCLDGERIKLRGIK
jgi:opacity protein-like surface antigen